MNRARSAAIAAEPESNIDERILEHALEAFAERGFHGTSIPELLRAAQVGASSFYRRYPSKEALVNAVFRRQKAALQAALEHGLDRLQPPRALFDDFWGRLARFARSHPRSFRFLELQDHVPYLDAESRAQELAVLAPIYVACLDFQQHGVWRADIRPEAAIALVWGAFVGLCKAERLGYFALTPTMITDGRDACWRALATSSVDDSRSPRKEPAHADANVHSRPLAPAAERSAAHLRKPRRARR